MDMKLKQTAAGYKGALKEFCPFPKAEQREAYEGLPDSLKQTILKEGEAYLGYRYPSILAADFMKFKRTGNRVDYEKLYFARRHALCALAAAECIEYEGRFLDDIINGIFAICEESAWQLPPHNSYLRDMPQLLLPDNSKPVMDLFACETGALLACVNYLLKSKYDNISPFISERIHRELENRIIMPYLSEHFWWMGSGGEPMCNWTAWCTQNVLLTIFMEDFADDLRLRTLRKAAESCDYFLKDYGEDGCCDEGAHYYRHAGLCLCNSLEILNAVTDGAFRSVFGLSKIKNIAAYIMNVHVDDKYYFNFADCSPVAGRADVQDYLFGKLTGQPELMQFAADDFRAGGGQLYSDEVGRLSLYHRMRNIFYREEVMSYQSNIPSARRDLFYPSVGLFLARSSSLCLAVKAGGNGDNHNHNDTGSFILYKNGRPVFIDIGIESYTEKTFSAERYEIWTMQSGYHNLPTLMGLDEKDGSCFCASNVDTVFCEDYASISMELATAYPFSPQDGFDEAVPGGMTEAPSYRRCITLQKKMNKVSIRDTTNCSDAVLNFMVCEKPEISQNTIKIGGTACAEFSGASLYALEAFPVTDARLRTAWSGNLYRIRLKMDNNVFIMEV